MKRPFASVAIVSAEIPERTCASFMAKVAVRGDDECWEWTGSRTPRGYGRFNLFGSSTTAQRAGYAILVGDLAPGLTIDHLCENPSCVNPAHLEAVPHRVNLLRGSRSACANNARKERCPRDHEYATYFHKSNGRTQRYCPTCKKDKGREWMRRHRAALKAAA